VAQGDAGRIGGGHRPGARRRRRLRAADRDSAGERLRR
jgi:hypothetical protein